MEKEQIKTYKFRSDLEANFEILSLDTFCEAKHPILFSPHRTDFYHIIFFTGGEGQHYIDFSAVPIVSPMVLFVNRDRVHVFDQAHKLQAKALIFTEDFLTKSALDLKYLQSSSLFKDPFRLATVSMEVNSILYDLWVQMEREYQMNKDKYHTDIFRNLLLAFLFTAERALENTGNSHKLQSQEWEITLAYQALVDLHFKTVRKVNEYVDLLGITNKKLSRATWLTMGKTPKQVVDDRLVLEIKRVLAYTNKSIKEIAFELGFDEPTNFVKYFKKHTNYVPSDFRETQLLGEN